MQLIVATDNANTLTSVTAHFASADAGAGRRDGDRDLPPLVKANTDTLRLPTAEEVRIADEETEARISLALGKFMVLGADLLWLVLSLALLDDFRWSITVLLAVDLLIAFSRRSEHMSGQLELLSRGFLGVGLFTFEAAFFGAGWPLIFGQGMILAAAALQAFGAGGEGKNLLGGLLVFTGLVFAMALSLVVLGLRQQDIASRFDTAYIYAAAGRREDALFVVKSVIDDNFEDPQVHMRAVNFYLSDFINDVAAASLAADRAVQFADDESRAQAYYIRGYLQEQRQDYVSALVSYNAAIDQSDDIPALYLTRSRTLIELGRIQEAIEDLRRVEEMAPGSDEATEARIMRINIEPRTGDPLDFS